MKHFIRAFKEIGTALFGAISIIAVIGLCHCCYYVRSYFTRRYCFGYFLFHPRAKGEQ